jgi:carboxyl-terminal processing protease
MIRYILSTSLLFLFLASCSDTPTSSTPDNTTNSTPEKLLSLWYDSLQYYSYYSEGLASNYKDYQSVNEMFYSLNDTLRGNYYTQYYEETEAKSYREYDYIPSDTQLGVMMSTLNDTLFMSKVFAESPAEVAGLKTGDKIIMVDSFPIYGNYSVFNALTQSSTKEYKFHRVNDGVDDTVSVKKGAFTPPVSYYDSLTPTVGYIHLSTFMADENSFGGSTSEQFGNSLLNTQKYAATIIDLRNNGGGYINECANIASEFLDIGDTIVLYNNLVSHGNSYVPLLIDTLTVNSGSIGDKDRKFVLLADEWSASASEMLIAALQYKLDIPLVGKTTYGKAIGQVILDMETTDYGIGSITFAKFVTPDATKYEHIGLVPDYPVEYSESEDKQLLKAIEVAESMVATRSRDAVLPATIAAKVSAIRNFNETLPHSEPTAPEFSRDDVKRFIK